MLPSPSSPESIREMFSQLAPSYDLSNNLISFGLHRNWKRHLVRLSGAAPGMRALDCACGTGDIAIELARVTGASGSVIGVDFSSRMLEVARTRPRRGNEWVSYEHADISRLPYSDASFDIATIGFGIRNVENPARVLAEMARVVRPGGHVLVLETGQPQGAFMKPAYYIYSRFLIPLVGGIISANLRAYRYLNKSSTDFPWGDEFVAIARSTGSFGHIEQHELCFGCAYIYKCYVKQR